MSSIPDESTFALLMDMPKFEDGWTAHGGFNNVLFLDGHVKHMRVGSVGPYRYNGLLYRKGEPMEGSESIR